MSAPSHPRPLHVVPHTHWDREWYRTFESYRYRLVRTLDRVLGANLPYFLLDGQTAVIDDYLALRPEQATPLRERIREGRLGIGPWFVLVDEFLVSGEALVRNLQVGRATMKALGSQGEGVGYLPDMFGHVAQMPQVLAGFGLDLAVVWRGVAPERPRFKWSAPDGSHVTAAWLPAGYYQTMLMEELPVEERQAQLCKYMEAFGDEPAAWLLAGADHMAPRADTAALLSAVQEGLPDTALEITSLRDALLGPKPVVEVKGELREPKHMAYILPGVLSARVPLKQANVACQTLLERYVEPLTALAWAEGRPYPAAFMTHAWRTLMLNHPHDSICGCSIDQVHREMWPRFAAVQQVGEELLATAVQAYDRPRATPGVFAFNPSSRAWDGWLELDVDWPQDGAPEAVTLEGASAVHQLAVTDLEVFRAEIDFNPDWFKVRRFRVAAKVALPALGGVQLKAVAAEAAPVAPAGVKAADTSLENGLLALTVADGRVALRDKQTGESFADCHGFLDEGDAGDEYNFSPLEADAPRRAVLKSTRVAAVQPHYATLEAVYELTMPTGLAADRATREGEVTLKLVSRFTLRAGASAVEVETTVDNQAMDHRLRLVVGWVAERPRIFAEGAFGVFEREPVEATPMPVPKRTEAIMPEFPTAGLTALTAGSRGLGVVGVGLHEAAWLDEGALGLTLLRSVGWLSRDDLRSRGGGAGPRFETPEAQCLGEQTFRYALIPGGADWTPMLHAAHEFLAPPRAWLADGVKAPGMALGDARLLASALTRSQDGRSLVLRAVNATGDAFDAAPPREDARAVRLDETTDASVSTTSFRPHEIKTWLLSK